jgi:hypothetical protein
VAQESLDGNKEPPRMSSRDAQTSLPIPPSHDARFVDLCGSVFAGSRGRRSRWLSLRLFETDRLWLEGLDLEDQ